MQHVEQMAVRQSSTQLDFSNLCLEVFNHSSHRGNIVL